jgi:hypothetical protein
VGIVSRSQGGGGGGVTPGTVIPDADPSGATVDTTTYNNDWTGVGKLHTLVFPQSTVAIAIAIAGDAFPRIVSLSNPVDGIYYGDGTVNPINVGAATWIEAATPGEFVHVTEGGQATQLRVGVPDTNRGHQVASPYGFTLGDGGAGLGATLSSSTGVPAIGGNLNDLHIRLDAPDVNHWLYRCTAAGVAGVATWTAVGGLV